MPVIESIPLYYGKSPARGDFLKSKGQYALIQLLDQWIAEALEHVIHAPGFDAMYANLPPLDFFIANPEKNILLVANMIASADSSGRKFPMVLSHLLDVPQLNQYLAYVPHVYKSVIFDLFRMNKSIKQITDADALMTKLSQMESKIHVLAYQDSKDFFTEHTLYSFAQLMKVNIHQLVQSMIGLGLLLQPVLRKGTDKLNKVLILPLNNTQYCYEVAAFWVNLIHQFLPITNTEFLIGMLHQEKPLLLFGFQGANILALSDIFTHNLDSERWVSLLNAAWVDDYLAQNAGLATLEQRLSERQMSLNQAVKIFTQSFIGERS